MLRDITLGQYYPAESILHRLDPRVKLFGTLCYLVCAFVFGDIKTFVMLTAALIAMIVISHVPFGFMVRGLRSILVLLILTAVLNMFLSTGDVIFSFYFLHITKQGVTVAVKMVIRLCYIVVGTSLLTLTTTPTQLTDALEKSLHPLRRVGIPVHEIAMMMSIALRFIPILVEETDKIMKAQAARGAAFDEGNLIQRVKALIPVLVPLVVSAFRRASDLAMAMEARCYHGGEGRTRMKPLTYANRDRIAYFVILAYTAAFVAVKML